METFLNIKTPDNFTIYGVLHTPENNGADNSPRRLIIFVHGYTGNYNEHAFYNASPFFNAADFATYRFNSYWYEKDARHLKLITFEEHVADLETVINHFGDSYDAIYLVGHSLGAQIISRANLSNKNIKGLTYWDPCREAKEICAELEHDNNLGIYIENSNVEIIVGSNFVESCKNLSHVQTFLPNIEIPILVVGAENAGAKVASDTYFPYIKSEKELFIIPGSNHTFDERGAEKTLFEKTLSWFKKY
jgi:pimeloyl-ACP methyl ester carboxylesterase